MTIIFRHVFPKEMFMFIKEMVVLFGKMLVFSRVMVLFLGVFPKDMLVLHVEMFVFPKDLMFMFFGEMFVLHREGDPCVPKGKWLYSLVCF
jgi:hypothetical protein